MFAPSFSRSRNGAVALAAGMLVAAAVAGCDAPDVVDDGVRVVRGGDLLAAAPSVSVGDSAGGDVMAAGVDVRFTGAAGGDLLVAGGRQVLGGRAEGSVRAAGGYVGMATHVGRNVTLAGSRVYVARPARIQGNAYLAGGSVEFEGRAEQLVRVMGGDVVLNGVINGDVLVEAGRLRLGPEAVIAGDLRYRLSRGQEAIVHPSAHVGGEVLPLGPRPGRWVPWAVRGLWILSFMFAGVVIIALAPVLTRAVEARLRHRPLAALLMGIAVLLLVPIVLAAFAVTVIGIPLALVGAALLLAAVYVAPLVVGLWLGRVLLSGPSDPGRGEMMLAFLLGALILGLIGLVPYIGPAVLILSVIFGIGALMVALWEGALRTEAVPR